MHPVPHPCLSFNINFQIGWPPPYSPGPCTTPRQPGLRRWHITGSGDQTSTTKTLDEGGVRSGCSGLAFIGAVISYIRSDFQLIVYCSHMYSDSRLAIQHGGYLGMWTLDRWVKCRIQCWPSNVVFGETEGFCYLLPHDERIDCRQVNQLKHRGMQILTTWHLMWSRSCRAPLILRTFLSIHFR